MAEGKLKLLGLLLQALQLLLMRLLGLTLIELLLLQPALGLLKLLIQLQHRPLRVSGHLNLSQSLLQRGDLLSQDGELLLFGLGFLLALPLLLLHAELSLLSEVSQLLLHPANFFLMPQLLLGQLSLNFLNALALPLLQLLGLPCHAGGEVELLLLFRDFLLVLPQPALQLGLGGALGLLTILKLLLQGVCLLLIKLSGLQSFLELLLAGTLLRLLLGAALLQLLPELLRVQLLLLQCQREVLELGLELGDSGLLPLLGLLQLFLSFLQCGLQLRHGTLHGLVLAPLGFQRGLDGSGSASGRPRGLRLQAMEQSDKLGHALVVESQPGGGLLRHTALHLQLFLKSRLRLVLQTVHHGVQSTRRGANSLRTVPTESSQGTVPVLHFSAGPRACVWGEVPCNGTADKVRREGAALQLLHLDLQLPVALHAR
eukprot:RCo041187